MKTDEEVTAVEQQEEQDTELEERAARRLAEAQEDFDFLVDRFNRHYAKAIAGLDEEREELAREWRAVEQTSQESEALLPARGRILRYESDLLLVAGKHEEAQAKLEEMKAAEEAPRLMRERQQEIHRAGISAAGNSSGLEKMPFSSRSSTACAISSSRSRTKPILRVTA